MAAEGKLVETKQGLNPGLRPASLANFTQQDKASENECSLSDASSSIYSLTNTTSCINNAFRQEPIAEPGHDGTNSKLYGNARDESETSFKGMQSNNESVVCNITGYNPYATGSGSMAGVDGKCIGPKPNVSVSSPTASLKSRHSNSIKTSGTVDAKVQLSSKSFLSTPSSNFFKCSLQSQHFKSSNKVPQLGSDYRPAMLCKGSYSEKNLSSPSNQVRGLFSNGPSSYRPSVQTGGCYDGYKMGEKSNSSCNYETQKESARGPRSRRVHTLLNSSYEKELLGPGVRRDRYNRSDFQTVYDNAKFFVIKSYSEDDIHKSIKYDVWSSTPNGNRKLNAAFHDAVARYSEKGSRCPIFLFFSVNGSGQFLGLAEMIGPVDFEKDMDFWQQDKWSGFFPVTWQIIKDIPNNRLRHIILENNDNKPVTYTRDTQEVGLKQGLEMLSIFKNYSPITSMLDDYKFYEDLEKLFQLRKSLKEDYPEYDRYRTDSRERNFQAGPRKAEQVSTRARNMSDSYTSLAALARNLSLNHNNTNAGNNMGNI